MLTLALTLGFLFGHYLAKFSGLTLRRAQKFDAEGHFIDDLFYKIRIFCWVATYEQHHKTRDYAISETWGRHCNRIIYVSNTTDKNLEIVILDEKRENWNNLWFKTREAFKWIYANVLDQYDWFAKADDDTFYHMANLRHYLKDYSPNEAIAAGHLFEENNITNSRYHSGGAGYVLSRRAVKIMVKEWEKKFLDAEECQTRHFAEDVFVGKCLQKLNATLLNTADNEGRYRFMPLAMYHIMEEMPSWINENSVQKIMNPSKCCSPDFIGMNYATPELEFFMYYATYILRPFGVQYTSR